MTVEANAADKGMKTDDRADTHQPAAEPPGQRQVQADPGKATLPEGAIPTGMANAVAGTAPADDADGQDGEAPELAPESYELAVPQGFEVDAKGMEAFKAAAAKFKLPKEGAQELFDMFHARLQDSAKASQDGLRKRMEELYAADRKAIDSDPDYGGRNFKRSQELVAKALVRFAGERNQAGEFEFVNELKDRGMANSPKLFRFLVRVGEFLSEAGPAVSDGRGAPAEKSPQEVLFDDYKKA